MKKKIVLLALALVMVSGVVFAAGGQSGGAASGASGTTTLKLWHHNNTANRMVPIENAARRFEQQNPGVKVEVEMVVNDAYKTKLKTVSSSPSDFPDVFHSWGGGWLRDFVDAGLVADITTEAQKVASIIGQNNLNFASYNGKIYGLPYITTSTVLYYNKDLFAKYNLPFPKTLAEMDNAAKVFIANGIIPFTVANRSKWPGAQYFVLLSMRYGGPDIFQRAIDKKVKFTDDAFIKAGDELLRQIKAGWFPAGANGLNSDQRQELAMFYQEKAAMIIMTSGTIGAIQEDAPEFFEKKLGIALYPAIDGAPGKATDLLAGGNVFSAAANSKSAISAKLVAFLATDIELQQALHATGAIPVPQTGIKPANPIMDDLVKQMGSATFIQNYIDQTLSAELAELHKDTTQALFGQTMTSRQAAEEMQKAFDK